MTITEEKIENFRKMLKSFDNFDTSFELKERKAEFEEIISLLENVIYFYKEKLNDRSI